MKVLEIHGRTGTSKILVGERIQNLPCYVPEGRAVLITDRNVGGMYPNVFRGRESIELPAGEETKSLATVTRIYERLIDLEADRSSFIVGVGGGVVCDVAGFAAATFLRGLRFGCVATSLLAQADASIGGKTGVNFQGYKNMVGVFRQPEFVICDPGFLSTLPRREVLSGMAEIVKHAAIGSAAFFAVLEERFREALALDAEVLEDLVYESAAIKAAVVGRDETESGERRILNFGHTLGHALETRLGLSHGEAVSVGMALAVELSTRKGLLPSSEAQRFGALLQSLGLPTSVSFDPAALLDGVRKDKKRTAGHLKFVLLAGIGRPIIEDLAIQDLEKSLHDLC